MKDTKINCAAKNCYWNIGNSYWDFLGKNEENTDNEEDNCCCGKVCILESGRCQNFVTVEEAKRRLKIAETKLEKEKGGE